MKRIRSLSSFALVVLTLASESFAQQTAPSATALSIEQLRAGFTNPPAAARLRCYWWWLNGHTDKTTISHDLEEMRSKGFGGALLVDANGSNQEGNANVAPGPTFGSPAWINLYTHALHEADRLGLEITLNITSGWNLGGPDVAPEQASKILTYARTQVDGGRHIAIQLPEPTAKNGFYKQIAVLAFPLHHGVELPKALSGPPLRARAAAAETGSSMPDATAMLDAGDDAKNDSSADASIKEVRNLAEYVKSDGALSWEVPEGQWEILRIGYTDSDARVSTSSGSWQGLAIDYLSREAFTTYWDHTVEPLLSAAKPFHSLKYLASDSWELGGTNWTQTFTDEFKKRRGYDPVPWLPVVAGRVIENRDQSVRFLTDLRRTVADLVVSNHYDVFAEKAAAHGLGIQAESGGPHGAPIDALETFRRAAVPQTEFWSQNPHRAKDVERFFSKEAASAANIYGKRFVAQEGETSIGPQWSESLADDLKPSFDMAITEGMNRLVWHEFTSSPADSGLPGQEYFAGTHLNPKVTWWNAGGPFFTYLNRTQFLMQQGTPVNDVLYFYGDNVPNFVRLKEDDPAHVLPGYDYDVTDEDALLHTIRQEGRNLVGPYGVHWRALVLPKSGRVSLPVLKIVSNYVQGGGVLIGSKPTSTTGIVGVEARARFLALVKSIWGESCSEGSHHSYGKGQVFCTKDSRAVLSELKVEPDVAPVSTTDDVLSANSSSRLDYIHRRLGSTDIYFFRNATDKMEDHNLILRSKASAIELWNAVDGTMKRIADTQVLHDGRTRVHFGLAPFGSAFIVFGQLGSSSADVVNTAAIRTEPALPTKNWLLTFQSGRGGPATSVMYSDLKSWSESTDPAVRYFSGTALYTTEMAAPMYSGTDQVFLHFKGVREIARVRVNGRDAGTIWAHPFSIRVDPLLTRGLNKVEVEVTNLWANRIIGDQQPDQQHRYTNTNIRHYKASSPLLPSGLIGPAEWQITHK